MIEASSVWTVALDGGTTNTRARLLRGNQVVATVRKSVGVRDTVLSGSGHSPLIEAVRDAIAEVLQQGHCPKPDRIIAAGMLGAPDVGLAAVPHVIAPAGVDELARGALVVLIPEVSAVPILFIPGVRTPPGDGPDGWVEVDVMRGEECETLGAWLHVPVSGPVAYVWPGSHTKYVMVDQSGRIVGSTTSLAGELTMAVARHTLIAGSLPDEWPTDLDSDAVALAQRLVVEQDTPLMRLAFLVRVAALTKSLTAEQRVAFWIAAVAASDALHLGTTAQMNILIGGRGSLRTLYREVIGRVSPHRVNSLDEETNERASAWGALAIADRWGELLVSAAEPTP